MKKQYVDSRYGQVHVVEEGVGQPVVLLHQSPRSWDEYRDVLPILGREMRAVALDTLDYGASARLEQAQSVDVFADAVEDVIDGLGLGRPVLVGHHTGGVVALEVAARRGDRVAGLVLSGTPYVDAKRRQEVATSRPPIDLVHSVEDGSHLQELWNRRRSFYPTGVTGTELLTRLVADALRVMDRIEDGHLAVNAYRMEDRVGLIDVPTLVLCGELDTFSLPDVARFEEAIPQSTSLILPGTGVPAVDHTPEAFAAAVADFIKGQLGPADV